MELKETKHLSTSAELNVVTPSEKNVLFPPEEGEPDITVDDKYSNKNHEKPEFGNVSTLDWLKTWRSTQIS